MSGWTCLALVFFAFALGVVSGGSADQKEAEDAKLAATILIIAGGAIALVRATIAFNT